MPASPEVLAGARSVFAEVGFHAASMERIASAAGLSRVTLHRRGITKETLLADLVAEGVERYRTLLWPALTGEGSGRERLELALRALCDAAESDLSLLLALESRSDGVFHDPDQPALTSSDFTAPFERILRDGAGDGSLDVDDPARAATLLFNAVGWTYMHLRSGHGWPAGAARDELVELVMRGAASRS